MTLYEMYLSTDESAVKSVTVCDESGECTFDSVWDAMSYYGEDREINSLLSSAEPDEDGNIVLRLLESESIMSRRFESASYHW